MHNLWIPWFLDACNKFTTIKLLFSGLYCQIIAWQCVKKFVKREGFCNKSFYSTILSGKEHIFRMIFTVENCAQFRFHFPAIIFITFNNQTIVDSKTNFLAWKVRCVLFPKRVLFKFYSFPLKLKPLSTLSIGPELKTVLKCLKIVVKQEGTEAMSVVRGAHCVVPFLVPLLTIKLNYYHMLNCCTR